MDEEIEEVALMLKAINDIKPYLIRNLLVADKTKSILEIWHERTGHICEQYLRKMSRLGMVKGMPSFNNIPPMKPCDTCLKAKARVLPFLAGQNEEEREKGVSE